MNPNLIPVEGRPGEFIDPERNVLLSYGRDGQLVTMDLGIGDVHTGQALTNFAVGYKQAEMIADAVAAPVTVQQQSDSFYIFDPKNELQAVDATAGAAGGAVPEINFQLSTSPYSCVKYSLGGFIPNELIANADAIIQPGMRLVRTIMKKLQLNRELRVKAKLFDATNYTTGHVTALSAAEKWNGGGNSDPVRNIRALVEAALAPVSNIVLDRRTWNAFTENPAVQKYTAFKSSAPPVPGTSAAKQWAAMLDIPEPIISDAKVLTSAGFPYVWSGSVGLIHSEPAGQADGMTTASMKTFRFDGAAGAPSAADAMSGGMSSPGFSVRVIQNPYRGTGGMYVTVSHWDAEQFLTDLVGGLITGAYA